LSLPAPADGGCSFQESIVLPTTTVVYAPHFEEASKALGATLANIAGGQSLVRLYEEKSPLVDIRDVEVTNHPKFYPWQRLKERRFTVRVIVERVTDDQDNETITVQCVLPRWSDTYDEVLTL
jgi:hypothetical protein